MFQGQSDQESVNYINDSAHFDITPNVLQRHMIINQPTP